MSRAKLMAKTKATGAKKPAKKIVDITHPNASAPSETSKPIIVTNRSLIRDPMMAPAPSAPSEAVVIKKTAAVPAVPAATELAEPTKPALATVSHEKIILPPSSRQAVVTPTSTATATNNEPAAAQPAKAAQFTLSESIPEPSDTEVETISEPQTPAAMEAQAESEKDAKALAIDKMIETQQYFLPVDTVELKRVKHFVWLGVGLIVLLAAAWFCVALDANLIQIDGLEAPTNFFSN